MNYRPSEPAVILFRRAPIMQLKTTVPLEENTARGHTQYNIHKTYTRIYLINVFGIHREKSEQ